MSFTRRFFLRGAGAALLPLPLLPSLLSPKQAAAALMDNQRCFAHFCTSHGGVWPENMWPSMPAATIEKRTYAAREIRHSALQLGPLGNKVGVSRVLSAPSSIFSAKLLGKMNALQGLDVPFYLGHNSAGLVGNFSANDGNGDPGKYAQVNAKRPTIDHLMANSKEFYPDSAGVKMPVMVMGYGGGGYHSFRYNQSGVLTGVGNSADTPLGLFDALFPNPGVPQPKRPLIVDRVLEDYRRLTKNPRLSQVDKGRLNDHVESLTQLQQRLAVSTASCEVAGKRPDKVAESTRHPSEVAYTNQSAVQAGWFRVLNEIIALAFSCGVSRVANVRALPTFAERTVGDWHEPIAHQCWQQNGVAQNVLADAHQLFFEKVFVDLAAKLDQYAGPNGQSVLDQSLLVWTQECGQRTHDHDAVPVITFGGAQNALKTGNHCDYRNLSFVNRTGDVANGERGLNQHCGLLWHQWLGTTLQAMKIPRAQWEKPQTNFGYPDFKYISNDWAKVTADVAYPQAVWDVAQETLPWL